MLVMLLKSTILFSFFIILNLTITAQKNNPNAIPITKEDALKFKTVNDVLNLPLAYEVTACTIFFTFKDGIMYPVGPQTPANPSIRSMIFSAKAGNRMTFTDIILKKGDRRIKLESKTYIFK